MAAIIPFIVFMIFYGGLSLYAGDTNAIPMAVALAVAGAAAVALDRGRPYGRRIADFTRNMGDPDLMLMCLIFAFAGAFATISKAAGSVNAAVTLARACLPPHALLAGLFTVSCLISLALGTSCGTIAALTPIAFGFAGQGAFSPGWLAGAIVGGAMFGDNLSMISDTTVAAVRTLGIGMRDKFRANLAVALPAAALAVLIYLFLGRTTASAAVSPDPVTFRHLLLILPYVLIFVLALAGLDVLLLLFSGCAFTLGLGLALGSFGFFDALKALGDGMGDMSRTLIIALLAVGLLGYLRDRGGLSRLIDWLAVRVKGPRSCEAAMATLVVLLGVFTANNTLAILLAGPVARDCADRFSVSRIRLAAALDVFACVVQGFLPYGGQILIVLALAQGAGVALSAGEVIRALVYPQLLGLVAILALVCRGRQKDSETSQRR